MDPVSFRFVLWLALAALACACGGPGDPRSTRGPGMVDELYRDIHSQLSAPAHWVVRTEEEWAETRRRIGPAADRMRAEIRPDFARDMLVVAAAGEGSSDDPRVIFEGYRDEGSTRYVFIGYSAGCDAAQDVTRAFVVGSVPRWEGEVKLVARWTLPDC
jgi:hypothetical protein